MRRKEHANHDEKFGAMVANIISGKPLNGDNMSAFNDYCQLFGNSNDQEKIKLINEGQKLLN